MKFNLLRNSLANLAGGLVPALLTLLTLPFIVGALGTESYGVLVLITSIIGYFAMLDLNVTAGSVKFVAEYHAAHNIGARNQTIVCGLGMYAAIGVVGYLLITLFYNSLIINIFSVPEALRPEATQALYLAAWGFLFGQIQIYLQSVPQAIRRYDWTAAVESVFGILVPLATVMVLWLGHGLVEVVLVRVVASVINIALLAVVIRKLLPDFRFERPGRQILVSIARFSGFAYLSRITTVAYTQGDKLIVGAVLTMSALAHYAIPFMLVGRLYALTYRLGSILFPVASALGTTNDARRLRDIYLYGTRYTFFVNVAVASVLVILAREILHYWMGKDVAEAGAGILVILTLASLANSLTNVPSLVNDGLGHPKVTGLFSIAHAVVGLLLAFLLVTPYGIAGAAYAQLITSTFAALVFLGFVHGRTIPASLRTFLRIAVVPAVPVIVIACAFALWRPAGEVLGPSATATALVLQLLLLTTYGFFVVFRRNDRIALMARVLHKSPAN